MKRWMPLVCSFCMLWGCARVQVEGPKEAIKVDISMRLDIYQHVSQDIDEIENIVSGGQPVPATPSGQSLRRGFFCSRAYAQEGLSPEVEQAAVRRRDRRPQLAAWQQQGVVGENKDGLAEIRDPSRQDAGLAALVAAENGDRMIIYRAVAQKNNTSVEQVQRLYAERLQNDAPAGTPVETPAGPGIFQWKIK